MRRVISQQKLNRSIISIEISKEIMPKQMCGLYILDVPFSHPIVQDAVTKNAKMERYKWQQVLHRQKLNSLGNARYAGMSSILWFFYLCRRIDESGMSRPYHSSKCLSFWCGPNNVALCVLFSDCAKRAENSSLRFLDPYEFDFDVP